MVKKITFRRVASFAAPSEGQIVIQRVAGYRDAHTSRGTTNDIDIAKQISTDLYDHVNQLITRLNQPRTSSLPSLHSRSVCS